MQKKNTVIVNKLAGKRADLVGFCRYLKNDKVSMDTLKVEEISKTENLSASKHVLVINDTTEFNYKLHENYLSSTDKDLGPAGNNEDIGFFLHPGLVVDAEKGIALGYSYIKIWNRTWDKLDKKERKYKQQPIEEKESYRWIECAQQSKQSVSSAKMITIIADRESDIYEEFATVPDQKTHLLIRSRCNRHLTDGHTLYEKADETTVCGTYSLNIKTTKYRKGRISDIDVKYTKVKLLKPVKFKNDNTPQFVELTLVEAREKKENLPQGEQPVLWRLLTTHAVNSFDDAIQIIQWYSMRWQIELLFNTLKTGGLNMESSELETGKALKKLCVIALGVALKITQLRQMRDDQSNEPATIVFNNEEIKVIKALVPQYEGNTLKQKNPFQENSIAWAAWLIARLGGWKGYQNESPPGNKTFKWGLDAFCSIYEGYKIAQEMCA